MFVAFKLFAAHLFIAISAIACVSIHYSSYNITIFTLPIFAGLYFLSGYIFTPRGASFQWKVYSLTALIGILLFALAYINAPDNLHFKTTSIFWIIYFFYSESFMGILRQLFPDYTQNVNSIHLVILFLATLFPSLFQALGGYLKIMLSKQKL